jgi:hypothetical protein
LLLGLIGDSIEHAAMTTATPTPASKRRRLSRSLDFWAARPYLALLALGAFALAPAPGVHAREPGLAETSAALELKSAPASRLAATPTLLLAPGLEAPQRLYDDIPSSWVAAQSGKAANAAGTAATPQRDWWSDMATRGSYAIPAAEILGFQFLLNRFDKAFVGPEYNVSASSIRRNLRSKWVVDNDPYEVNQLGHPYAGSMYHGFARSAGLNYWESLGYAFAGSFVWEIAGETTTPSKNDQVMTGIGGSFLGEALFRMANLVLEQGGGLSPQWREVAAAAISPPTGFNRLAFGDRFGAIYSSRNAEYYSRLSVGVSATTQNDPGTATKLKRNEGLVDYALDYGLPGKPGYTYKRPFDHFTFQATASTANGFENLVTRGLLIGTDYELGSTYRGVWGVYGGFDYFAPQLFRISSTSLSIGTTGEWRPSPAFAMQGTIGTGFGYAGVGTINGTRDTDYHYGIAPQALLSLRAIFGDRASFDWTAREYFVSNVASDSFGRGGHDNITRGDASFTVRVHKQHAIAVKYLWNRRDASYPVLGDRSQTRATVGIFYTLLGHDRFGSTDWR